MQTAAFVLLHNTVSVTSIWVPATLSFNITKLLVVALYSRAMMQVIPKGAKSYAKCVLRQRGTQRDTETHRERGRMR